VFVRSHTLPALAVGMIALAAAGSNTGLGAAPAASRGTIKGHVRLAGKLPGNPLVRMAVDPMCAKTNAGKRVIQEAVLAAADGSLANVFVRLQGTFPGTPVPSEPVTIDQRGCVYVPRVVGARVGQTLQIRNGDALLHNVHGVSAAGNSFNAGQPAAGMTNQFHLKDEEVMLRVRCDIHSWMTAYVGVVNHPYFAVSHPDGTFEIDNVPAGNHPIQAWHERYGPLTETARVKAGATTTIEFVYSGDEKPPAAAGRF
jgi:plastocyanin